MCTTGMTCDCMSHEHLCILLSVFLQNCLQKDSSGPVEPAAPPSPPASERGERRVKMTMLRQRVAGRLKGAQNTCAILPRRISKY